MSDSRHIDRFAASEPVDPSTAEAENARAAFSDLVYRPNEPNGRAAINTDLAMPRNSQIMPVAGQEKGAGAPAALDPSLWSSEPDTDKVMIGWALANGARSQNQNDYILGIPENYLKSHTVKGQTQLGPWDLNADVISQWAQGIDADKLKTKVDSKQLSADSAKMLSSEEFRKFFAGLGSGQPISAEQMAKFMPVDLQTTIAADLARGMAQAETQQLGSFDPGATVAAIQSGKVLDQAALADPQMSKYVRVIDSQLISMGSYPDLAAGSAGNAGNQTAASERAATQDTQQQAAKSPETASTGSYVTDPSAIPGDTVGPLFVNAPHNPQDQQIDANLAGQESALPGDTIGSLFVNSDGITGNTMGVPDSRASLLSNMRK